MKPFLKWAGGKYKIIDRILDALPKGEQLIEPFAGSGAVFLNADFDEYLIADTNADLINLFIQIKTEGHEFINYASSLFLAENNTEEAYYRFREEFNACSDIPRRSALFVYLNRHCFNGLCRYNSKGGFNVPFGQYAKPAFPEKEILNFYEKSKRAVFEVADFKSTMNKATKGSVVYCDPPYAPLTVTANFSDYTSNGFNDEDQKVLANSAEKLTLRDIPVVISNHDTEFTRLIYKDAEILSFDVQRFISSDTKNRNKAPELIACYGQASRNIIFETTKQTTKNTMIKGGVGGGNTITGLRFEEKTDLLQLLAATDGYKVLDSQIGKQILFNNKEVARCYRKHDLYRFLESCGIEWKKLISKKLLPDDALYVIHNNTLFVIEVKFQKVAGSVDEKLQTCDFKKKQYQKLMFQLNYEVEYIYILSDWFRDDSYKDSLDYIISVGCHYYFEYLPLHKLGLPVP